MIISGKANQIINVDIYNQDVMVHLGSLESLTKVLKKYMEQNIIDNVIREFEHTTLGHSLYEESKGVFIVFMPEKPINALGWGTLSHELLHVTNGIMKKVGIPFSQDTEEAYTYLLGFLTRKVMNNIIVNN